MDLMKYIEQAKKAYEKAYTAIDQATTKNNEAKKALKKQIAELKLIPSIQEEKSNAIRTEYRNTLNEINRVLEEELNAATGEYMKEVENYYMPSGSEINEEDMNLIRSGIKLSGNEVEKIVERNADNLTMIRLIAQYAADNKISLSNDCKLAFARAKLAGTAEKAALQTFIQYAGNCVRMANQGMADSETYFKCADKLQEYVDQAERDIKNAKVYLDEATRAELQEMKENENADKNKEMGTENINYL